MVSALVLQHAGAGSSEPSTSTPKPTLVNGGFEQPQQTQSSWVDGNEIPGWKSRDGWVGFNTGEDDTPEGNQYASITPSYAPLEQEVATTPGEEMVWRLKHSGHQSTMWLLLGAAGGYGTIQKPAGKGTFDITGSNGKWGEWYGIYQVPTGQTSTRVSLFAKYGQNNV
ncbi:hypothetical protein ACIQMR_38335, partial [Streptomyces sp. NPDC091376]